MYCYIFEGKNGLLKLYSIYDFKIFATYSLMYHFTEVKLRRKPSTTTALYHVFLQILSVF